MSIYVDYAATTPLDKQVIDVMTTTMEEDYGNPSSLHDEGMRIRKKINDVRMQIATYFNVMPSGVVFTSGGTEAINLAILGCAKKYPDKKEIVTSTIEHHATLHALDELREKGYIIHYLPVNKEGFIDIEILKQKLNTNTLLVTLIYANNEIGTIQDVKNIGKLCEEHDVLFHVDAVQMIGYHRMNMVDMHTDMLSLSAHKFYGPKGCGALIVKRDTILPIIYGGQQEKGKRAGTENVYGIMGLGKALSVVNGLMENDYKHAIKLRDTLCEHIISYMPQASFLGPKDRSRRLPNIISLHIPKVDAQRFLFVLNQHGVYASTGSACQSNVMKQSHVLKAIGISEDDTVIRLSIGRFNTIEEMSHLALELYKTFQEVTSSNE